VQNHLQINGTAKPLLSPQLNVADATNASVYVGPPLSLKSNFVSSKIS